jgi:hypothetical protein
MRRLASIAAVIGLVAWAVLAGPRVRTEAMPTFAQAYGVDCSLCHTFVPTLNAYGRYIQRTGYATLDKIVLKRAIPFWIGESAAYDTQDPNFPHKVQFGNFALHAAGAFGQDFTFHAHQWIVQNGESGGLDTLWVTYNNLLQRKGHLFVGKIEAPGPSVFSQWSDLSPFLTPQLTVGEHTWQNDANRWGAKFAYVNGPAANVQIAYLGADTDLNGATDFYPANGKAFQWSAAYAQPTKPFEAGVYGNVGTIPLMEGGIDRYKSIAGYMQRDPKYGVPGFLAIYQRGFDGNPGNGLPAANSLGYTVELYQTFLGDRVLVGLRREMTNDGLGTIIQGGAINVGYRINRFLRIYGQAGLTQNSTPGWAANLWWTTPVFKEH